MEYSKTAGATMAHQQVRSLFHDEYDFQDGCDELLATQPDSGPRIGYDPYGHHSVYGTRGQRQHGVDLVAERVDGKWDVGQCKYYEKLTEANIRSAVDEVLQYWDSHWKSKGVERFIIFTSANTQSNTLQNEVFAQVNRLKAYGIRFELWDASRIWQEIQGRRALKQRYAERLPGHTAGMLNMAAQYAPRLAILSAEFERDMESIIRNWKQRPQQEILVDLERLSDQARLAEDKTNQAKFIRLRAKWLLDSGDDQLILVRNLLTQATSLDAKDIEANQRLEASILLHEDRVQDAIDLLSSCTETKSIVQRAGIILHRIEHTRDENQSSDNEALLEIDRLLAGKVMDTNDDALRMRAIRRLHCLPGTTPNFGQALADLEKSLSITNSWSGRCLRAMIHYWQGMSPAAYPGKPIELPPLFSIEVAGPSPEARQKLLTAAGDFEYLAANSNLKTYQEFASIWLLATRQALGDERSVAMLARKLSEAESASPLSYWYALGVGAELDLEAIRMRIRENSDAEAPELEWVKLQFHRELCPEDDIDASSELLRFRDWALSDPESPDAWARKTWWLTEATARLVATNRLTEARSLQSHCVDDIELTTYLRLLCARGDKELEAEVIKEFDWHKHPLLLIDIVRALMRAGKPKEAANLIPVLRVQVGTVEAYRIGVRVASAANLPELVLEHFDNWPTNTEVLDPELVNHWIWAYHMTRQIVKASAASEVASKRRDFPESQQVFFLGRFAQFLEIIGDRRRALSVATELAEKSKSSRELIDSQLIALGILSHGEVADQEVAKNLLSHIECDALTDEQVISLYPLCKRLRTKTIATKLQSKFHAIAQRRPDLLQVNPSFQDVQRIFIERIQHGNSMLRSWYQGYVSIHDVAKHDPSQIARALHSVPDLIEASESYDTMHTPVFHGSRWIGKAPVDATGPYVMDITALLVCHHLGLLPEIEAAVNPIYLRQETLSLLALTKRKLAQQDYRRIDAIRRLVKEINLGSIRVLPESPDSEQGRWTASCMSDDADTPSSGRPFCSLEVVIWLKRAGLIDEATFRLFQEERGTEEPAVPENGADVSSLRHGTKLLSDSPTLLKFAEIPDLLVSLLKTLEVWLSHSHATILKQQLEEADQSNQLREWTEQLSSRLAGGLQATPARYVLESEQVDDEDAEGENKPITVELRNGLVESPDNGRAIWIDDRFTNTDTQTNTGRRIVSTLDVLATLQQSGSISRERYMAAIAKLRRGGFRYIALSLDELTYCLDRCEILNEEIVESKELTVIRRSYAASLRSPSGLQLIHPGGVDKSEISFVVRSSHVVAATIGHYAAQASPSSLAKIRWLLTSLFHEDGLLLELIDGASDSDALQRARAFTASQLIRAGSGVSGKKQRGDYLNLIWQAIVSNWFYQDLRFRKKLALVFAYEIRAMIAAAADQPPEFDRLGRLITARLIMSLPAPLKEFLIRTSDLQELLPLASTETVTLGSSGVFSLSDLVNAVVKALNDGASTRLASEEGFEIEISINEDKVRVLGKDGPGGVDDLLVAAATPDPKAWTDFIRDHALALDFAPGAKVETLDRLGSLVAPLERVSNWLKVTSKTIPAALQRLSEAIKNQENVSMELLVPSSVDALLNHIRIDRGEVDLPIEEIRRLSVERLLMEQPIPEVFFKVAGWPDASERDLASALTTLESDVQNATISAICVQVFFLHEVVQLFKMVGERAHDSLFRLANHIIERASVEDPQFFNTICKCVEVYSALQQLAVTGLEQEQRVSPQLIQVLSGIYAAQVMRVFHLHKVDLSQMDEILSELTASMRPVSFSRSELDELVEASHGSMTQLGQIASAFAILLAHHTGDFDDESSHRLHGRLALGACVLKDRLSGSGVSGPESDLQPYELAMLKNYDPAWTNEVNRDTRINKVRLALTHLASKEDAAEGQLQLLCSLGSQRIPEDLEDDLVQSINSLQAIDTISINTLGLLCHLASGIIAKDEKVATRLEELLIKGASDSSIKAGEIEYTVRLLVRSSKPKSPVGSYIRILRRCIQASPSLAAKLIPILLQVATSARPEDSPQLSGFLIEIRALVTRL